MTDQERTAMKAAAKVEDLAVDGDLSNLDGIVSGLIASIPAAEATQPVDPAELTGLVTAIKAGTATNNQSARFLEIISKVGPAQRSGGQSA